MTTEFNAASISGLKRFGASLRKGTKTEGGVLGLRVQGRIEALVKGQKGMRHQVPVCLLSRLLGEGLHEAGRCATPQEHVMAKSNQAGGVSVHLE